MAYDPTKPAGNSPVVSAELRAQFAGLKELIDQRPTAADVESSIQTETAGNCGGVASLDITISDPPTAADVQAISIKLQELMLALQRS